MSYSYNNYSQPYGNGAYPHMYEEPSAPPASPFPSPPPQYSPPPYSPPLYAGASAPSAAVAPDWEDCAICLENCGDHPDGDASKARVIAKTACNHYFHNFCLQRHLNNGMNQNCPMCRAPLSDRNITKINLDAQSNVEENVDEQNEAPIDLNDLLLVKMLRGAGAAAWYATSALANAGWWTTKAVGGAVLGGLSDFVWPKEIDPRSIQTINREVDRIHSEITKKVQKQQEAMRLLLGQVASIGQDRSRNPVEILKKIKALQTEVTNQAETYLQKTEALIAEMQRVSSRF